MDLWPYLGITWAGALAVVISSVVLYSVLAVIVRVWGAHLLGGRSAIALVVAAGLAAIAARGALGTTPTLLGSLTAIVTLGLLEIVFASFRRTLAPRKRGVIVMVGDHIAADVLRQHRVHPSAVWQGLRHHGIRRAEDVGILVLELNGTFSHLPPGEPIDARVLNGVAGRELVPADWLITPAPNPTNQGRKP